MMLKVLKKYWSIYGSFLSTSFVEAASYRVHFVLVIVMDLIFYGTSYLSVDFLYQHIDVIGPWSRQEFMFFMTFLLCLDHFHMTFVSGNFWEFSIGLRTGQLDFLLTKPVSSLFVSFFRHTRVSQLFNAPVPWGALIYFGIQCNLGVWQWIGLLPLFLMSCALMTILELLVSMLMFVTIESYGINYLRIQIQNIARWPDFIYSTWLRRIFFFGFPILMFGSLPVKILLGDESWWLLLLMAFMIVILGWLLRVLWWRGLRSYDSASS